MKVVLLSCVLYESRTRFSVYRICNSRVVCMYAHRPHTRTHRLNCTIVLKRNAALHRDQAPPVQQGVHRWT